MSAEQHATVQPPLDATLAPTATPSAGPVDAAGSSKPPRAPQPSDADITTVYDAWKEAHNAWAVKRGGRAGNPRLDAARRNVIRKALRMFPLGDVLLAVQGWVNVPFYRGDNDEGKVWDELDLVLRDARRIETCRDAALAPPPPPLVGPRRGRGANEPVLGDDGFTLTPATRWLIQHSQEQQRIHDEQEAART